MTALGEAEFSAEFSPRAENSKNGREREIRAGRHSLTRAFRRLAQWLTAHLKNIVREFRQCGGRMTEPLNLIPPRPDRDPRDPPKVKFIMPRLTPVSLVPLRLPTYVRKEPEPAPFFRAASPLPRNGNWAIIENLRKSELSMREIRRRFPELFL